MPLPVAVRGYPELYGIPENEWSNFFDRSGEPWSEEEDEYIQEWYSHVSTLEISYALGRLPWNVTTHAKELGVKKEILGHGMCKECGKGFNKLHTQQVYCSDECRLLCNARSDRERRKKKREKLKMMGA